VGCHDCGKENASLNLVCAYCGIPFVQDRVAALHRENAARARLVGALFAAALALPIVLYIIALTR
jgi:hypothetical protein